mmetsp:Transcript_14694/g.40532  ORF Transcript_14694/g.40532 Transcript_14694/m.40532 type:complete len:312 (+) Transcript_14694:301-1236(+)
MTFSASVSAASSRVAKVIAFHWWRNCSFGVTVGFISWNFLDSFTTRKNFSNTVRSSPFMSCKDNPTDSPHSANVSATACRTMSSNAGARNDPWYTVRVSVTWSKILFLLSSASPYGEVRALRPFSTKIAFDTACPRISGKNPCIWPRNCSIISGVTGFRWLSQWVTRRTNRFANSCWLSSLPHKPLSKSSGSFRSASVIRPILTTWIIASMPKAISNVTLESCRIDSASVRSGSLKPGESKTTSCRERPRCLTRPSCPSLGNTFSTRCVSPRAPLPSRATSVLPLVSMSKLMAVDLPVPNAPVMSTLNGSS